MNRLGKSNEDNYDIRQNLIATLIITIIQVSLKVNIICADCFN